MRSLLKLIFSVLIATVVTQANIINVPGDQPTIQAGIDVATDSDTVLVAPGTYQENINFLGKAIVVKSSHGPSVTTIQAPDSGSVVTFANGEGLSSILEGFTITGGMGTLDVDSQPWANYTALFGGGIFIKVSSPTIYGNIIMANYVMGLCASRGGGIAVKDSSNPIIVNNSIIVNSVIDVCDIINYFGGGIWVDSTSNPIIGGSEGAGNNIYVNSADNGRQLYRDGEGTVINAQYNYFGSCPPGEHDVYPSGAFDVLNCLDSILVSVDDVINMPRQFNLYQNYPNPFNSVTTISYELPELLFVNISIYNVAGQLVETLVNQQIPPGYHAVNWNANNFSSGVYFYKIMAGEYSATGKCLMLK